MSTYLVTGAAGFIASKVCELLLAEGHTVVGIDNLNDYYDVRLKFYRLGQVLRAAGGGDAEVARYGLDVAHFRKPEGSEINSGLRSQVSGFTHGTFTFRFLDVENLPALDALFAAHSFDAVFNLAARAGVRASLENPEIYRTTNIVGEENVLKCQVKHGVRKHLLASSSSVYAGCPMPFVEDAPLGRMQSPYADTKRAAELLAQRHHEQHGLDVTVLRYFTVFGPAGRPDMAPLRFIKWIDEGTPIALYGDGSQSRDFTYVDDIARGTILAASRKPETGNRKPEFKAEDSRPVGLGSETQVSGFRSQVSSYEVINLGGGNEPVSLHTMIGWIESALTGGTVSRPSASPVKAKINRLPASAADMHDTAADITKARTLLGWSPQVSPQEGFQRTVAWYLENKHWLKDVRV